MSGSEVDAQTERLGRAVALLTLFMAQENGIDALGIYVSEIIRDAQAGHRETTPGLLGGVILGMTELSDMILRQFADTVKVAPETILRRIALTPPAE